MDLHNLTDADRHRIAVRYYGIAVRSAKRLLRRFKNVDFDELVSECWFGVFVGAMEYDARFRTSLISWLFLQARSHGTVFARKAQRRGVTMRSQDPIKKVTQPPTFKRADPLRRGWAEPDTVTEIAASPRPDVWTDDEWSALLAPLRQQEREMAMAVFRQGEAMCDLVARFGCPYSTIKNWMTAVKEKLRRSESIQREIEP